MKVFVDESGAFTWQPPGWSIVAAVGIAENDGTLAAVTARLRTWERSLPSARRKGGEVKGARLTDDELRSFADGVLERKREQMQVTLSGFNSSMTSRAQVSKFREQQVTEMTPDFLRYAAAGNRRMTQTVRELIGWFGNRSEEQVAWLVCLEVAFAHALQHAVVVYMDGDDADLAAIRFVVDRSWLRQDRHLQFWRDLINSRLTGRSKASPLLMFNHWPPSHAFRRAYEWKDLGLDMRALWRKTVFARSDDEPGVRVADVVAHIAYRHFRQNRAGAAFASLERIIMGQGSILLHAVDPTPRETW